MFMVTLPPNDKAVFVPSQIMNDQLSPATDLFEFKVSVLANVVTCPPWLCAK